MMNGSRKKRQTLRRRRTRLWGPWWLSLRLPREDLRLQGRFLEKYLLYIEERTCNAVKPETPTDSGFSLLWTSDCHLSLYPSVHSDSIFLRFSVFVDPRFLSFIRSPSISAPTPHATPFRSSWIHQSGETLAEVVRSCRWKFPRLAISAQSVSRLAMSETELNSDCSDSSPILRCCESFFSTSACACAR